MDVRFKVPSNFYISGQSQCGKSYLVRRLLYYLNDLFHPVPSKVIYCYGEYQKEFDQLHGVEFIEGFPEDLNALTRGHEQTLLVLDDLMSECSKDQRVSDLFTRGSHHKGISVLYLTQNLFPPGKLSRTISLNSHYFIVFKNPRDSLGIATLAKQMFPRRTQYLMDTFTNEHFPWRKTYSIYAEVKTCTPSFDEELLKEIEMKNISVHIKKGEKTTFTFKKPIATYGTRIAAKEVTVFWNFRNITSTIGNNTFIRKKSENGGTDETKTINDGYYDFEQLKTRLAGEKLDLQMNAYDNTCIVENKNAVTVDLKKFGKLLGFPEKHEVSAGTSVASPKPVDVNHGLRWLTVTCDLIDPSKNIDLDGEESNILAFLPITPGTRLNSNCYVYERENAWRAAKNAIVSEMVFTVNSNITEKVDVDILLDLALE